MHILMGHRLCPYTFCIAFCRYHGGPLAHRHPTCPRIRIGQGRGSRLSWARVPYSERAWGGWGMHLCVRHGSMAHPPVPLFPSFTQAGAPAPPPTTAPATGASASARQPRYSAVLSSTASSRSTSSPTSSSSPACPASSSPATTGRGGPLPSPSPNQATTKKVRSRVGTPYDQSQYRSTSCLRLPVSSHGEGERTPGHPGIDATEYCRP